MNRASPQMRNLARRLIAFDASGNKSSRTKNPEVFQVCEKLRPQLATLVGNEAFRALLAHALALATEEVSGLSVVQVKPDGTLEISEELHAHVKADSFFEGRIVLLAHLLGLLVAFIGEDLTLRLVRESWPKVALTNLDFNAGDKNEIKK